MINQMVVGVKQMEWVLLSISSICFVVIFSRLNTFDHVKELNTISLKVFKTIRSPRISDHWKEKVLPRYASQLLSQSLTIFAVLLLSCSPFIASSILSIQFDGRFISLVSSFTGIMASTIVMILFTMLLSKKSSEDYGFGSKILHQIVLGGKNFGETIFDIEKLLHEAQCRDVSNGNHVFIAGLARAGTTILMRKMYENGEFCSLTYRDMPFILAPNTWRTVSSLSKRKSKMQERAHGDGIKVDYDSPEALEEVFWRTFCGYAYIKPNCLVPMDADSETLEKFRCFISLVLKNENDKCYLSKNNNNILRLNSINKTFPEALIVVPFREPLQQAFSLRKQHRRFENSKDKFTTKYMTWLAHHEFGADHRPFLFNEKVEDKEGTEKLSYWIRLWINTYSYLIEKLPPQAILLSYDKLCDETERVWKELSDRVKLAPYCDTISFSKSRHHIKEILPHDLISRANELYKQLISQSIGYR